MLQQNLSTQDLRNDGHIKLIKNRIELVETHFSNICLSFGSYVGKTAVLRDRGDDLSRRLKDYAIAETLNRSLKAKLSDFADCLSTVEDYRQALINRLEAKVIGQMSLYEKICKSAKENVKTSIRANERQLERQRQLQKLRDKSPINRQDIAETDLTKARVEAEKSCKTLSDSMQKFEQKKLQDIKRVLLNFIKTEMLFHAKSLELYTQAFNIINNINEEEDLKEWHNCVSLKYSTSLPISINKEASKSMESVQSLANHPQTSQYNSSDDTEEEEEDETESDESSAAPVQ